MTTQQEPKKTTPVTPSNPRPFKPQSPFQNPQFSNRPNLPKFNNNRFNSSFRTQSRGSGGK